MSTLVATVNQFVSTCRFSHTLVTGRTGTSKHCATLSQPLYSRIRNYQNLVKLRLNRFAHSNSCKMDNTSSRKILSLENMNQAVIKMEYAVRGPLVIRATEIQKELQEKVNTMFSRLYIR